MRLWETALLGVIELDSEKYGHQYSSAKLKEAAMEQVAREVAGQDLTVNIPRPRHRMLFLLLSILVLCTAPCASSARKRRKTPCTAGFNPSILRNATPSRSWIPPDTLVIPLGESHVYELRLADSTKSRPETGHYVFGNRVRQQTTLADGVYKVLIPPLQQADRLEFSAGDVVRRMRIVPKARPSLLSAAATVAYPEYMDRPDGREPMRAGVISAPEGLHADAGGYRLPASGLSPPRPRESPCAWTAAR